MTDVSEVTYVPNHLLASAKVKGKRVHKVKGINLFITRSEQERDEWLILGARAESWSAEPGVNVGHHMRMSDDAKGWDIILGPDQVPVGDHEVTGGE